MRPCNYAPTQLCAHTHAFTYPHNYTLTQLHTHAHTITHTRTRNYAHTRPHTACPHAFARPRPHAPAPPHPHAPTPPRPRAPAPPRPCAHAITRSRAPAHQCHAQNAMRTIETKKRNRKLRLKLQGTQFLIPGQTGLQKFVDYRAIIAPTITS